VLKNILKGIQAYFSAFRLLQKLKLWKYFIIPIFISLLTATLILVSAYGFSDNIGGFIAGLWKFNLGKEFISSASNVVGGFLVVVFGLIVYKHVVIAFSAPFMTPVSEKIESLYTGKKPSSVSFSNSLIRAIKINLRNFVKEILYVLPLFLLSLIPVIGLFFTVLIFFVQAYYAGFGNMDYTLERHFNYNDSIKFVKEHKGIALGNGIGFILLLMIPFFGPLLVLPLSAVSASEQTIKQIHQVS
jgi:CysZ protein